MYLRIFFTIGYQKSLILANQKSKSVIPNDLKCHLYWVSNYCIYSSTISYPIDVLCLSMLKTNSSHYSFLEFLLAILACLFFHILFKIRWSNSDKNPTGNFLRKGSCEIYRLI